MSDKRQNIIRVHKQANYTCVDNHFINDTRLSLKAKGVMVVLLSKPNDWEVTVGGIEASCCNGRECVMGTLKELESTGYLVREEVRDAGKFHYISTLYERPATDPHFQRNTPSRENRNGKTVTVNPTLLSTDNQLLLIPGAVAPAPVKPGKAKKPPKEVSPERAAYLFDKGEWYAYAKAAYADKYPGYVVTSKGEKGLSLIFDRVVGKDLVKAKAFLQCAFADGRNFLCGQRHDPMYLYSHANEWLTASRQWSGYKPELPDVSASRSAAIDAKRAEADRQRAEALEAEARQGKELSALADADREGLRVEYLATLEDGWLRGRLASADWRTNNALASGMHAMLRRRQLERVGTVL